MAVCFYFFIREVDKMKYNEPLTEEYYTEQKRLWDEMNNRNKINNASVLTNEQGFGFQNPILPKEGCRILALEIVKIMIDKLAE